MCITKVGSRNTCCCGCSLFTGTMLVGVLSLLSAIGAGMNLQWVSLAVSLFECLWFAAVLCDRESASIRELLYKFYLVLSIGLAIMFAVQIGMIAFSDNPKYDYYERSTCVIVGCVAFCIFVPIRFALCRVLYYGWDEVKHAGEDRSDSGYGNKHSAVMEPLLPDDR